MRWKWSVCMCVSGSAREKKAIWYLIGIIAISSFSRCFVFIPAHNGARFVCAAQRICSIRILSQVKAKEPRSNEPVGRNWLVRNTRRRNGKNNAQQQSATKREMKMGISYCYSFGMEGNGLVRPRVCRIILNLFRTQTTSAQTWTHNQKKLSTQYCNQTERNTLYGKSLPRKLCAQITRKRNGSCLIPALQRYQFNFPFLFGPRTRKEAKRKSLSAHIFCLLDSIVRRPFWALRIFSLLAAALACA